LKPPIAIIIPGGIGTGKNNIGVPVLEQIIGLLSVHFSITVFQLYNRNEDYRVQGFELIDVYSRNPFVKIIKFVFVFWNKQRKVKFAAIHGFWAMPNGFLAVVMGKIFGIKTIVSVLGGDAIALPEINYGQLRSALYRRLIFWTLRQANEVNALTQYLVNNLRQAGFVRSDIKIIPWGIDTTAFSFRKKTVQEPWQFLHIASFHPVKDQETLLRAFKLISDKIPAQLTLVGEGSSESQVRSLIDDFELQNSVNVLGLLPYDKLPALYHHADILLHTSLSEGQCEVVTEAMSCGVLVCGTRVGLMYDLPECCISVRVKDYERLAKEILQLIASPGVMEVLRERARSWTTAHSIVWTVEQLKLIYSTQLH
jgi:glycosyltransferase involved in cell wall biosynthesis